MVLMEVWTAKDAGVEDQGAKMKAHHTSLETFKGGAQTPFKTAETPFENVQLFLSVFKEPIPPTSTHRAVLGGI